MEDFSSRPRALLLLLCPMFLFLLLYFCLVPVLFPYGQNTGLWCALAGTWATWARSLASARLPFSCWGYVASVLSSAMSVFYFEETLLTNSLLWPLECFQMGSGTTNLPAWHLSVIYLFIIVNSKTGGTTSWFFCQVILS